jgi:hypothetical protein
MKYQRDDVMYRRQPMSKLKTEKRRLSCRKKPVKENQAKLNNGSRFGINAEPASTSDETACLGVAWRTWIAGVGVNIGE